MNKEIIQKVVESYKKHGSQRKAAKELGISRRTLRRYLDIHNAEEHLAPVGFKVTKVSSSYDKNNNLLGKSVVTKLAPQTDDKKRNGKVVRRSTLYGADGSVVGEWIIRKPEDEAQVGLINALEEKFTKNIKRFDSTKSPDIKDYSGDMALYLSVDEHLNVKILADLCTKEFNLNEAVDLIKLKFQQLVNRTTKTDKAIIVNLGDQFHANDHMKVTPASKHPLDTDRSEYETSLAAIELNRWKIDTLLMHYNSVEVHGVSGNHDVDPNGWLFRCLQIAYEKEPRVKIYFHPNEMFVLKHGSTFLGFHHGHKIKPEQLAGAMADRYAPIYGDTQNRYLHTRTCAS